MVDHNLTASNSMDAMLFLTDDQLLQGIELMYFAYKGFTSDPDLILQNYTYGRAHHRAVHFINRRKGLKVNDLLDILGITKQSLNRVLRQLINDGLVESRVGRQDKRERNLFLTDDGEKLDRQLSDAERKRMWSAYREAGPDAVMGFRLVLEKIMDGEMQRGSIKIKEKLT